MKTVQPRINEIVNFLVKNDKAQLDALKHKYPQYTQFLESGIILDDTGDIKEDELKFRLIVSEQGLNSLFIKGKRLLSALRNKIKRLDTVQLVSQIIVVISGATILSTLAANFDNSIILNYLPPSLVLIGALLTLYIKSRSESFLFNNENLYELYSKLISLNIEAKLLLTELEIVKKYFTIDNAKQNIEKANGLIKELSIIENKLR